MSIFGPLCTFCCGSTAHLWLLSGQQSEGLQASVQPDSNATLTSGAAKWHFCIQVEQRLAVILVLRLLGSGSVGPMRKIALGTREARGLFLAFD
jgi:hypothetical protein